MRATQRTLPVETTVDIAPTKSPIVQKAGPVYLFQDDSMLTTPPEQGFTVEDTSIAPHKLQSAIQGELSRKTWSDSNHVWQKFIVKNYITGDERELFSHVADGVAFEHIEPQNWSPTNRFVFVLIDSRVKKDILFFTTDGRFTDTQYYIHPTEMYPDISIEKAQWIDEDTVTVNALNQKMNQKQQYLIDFNDSVGSMSLIEKKDGLE
jgi:hypothetical protein